ncbi:MAG: hypothetical protein ACP5KA_07035 [Desulfurococcaceae archaeon]
MASGFKGFVLFKGVRAYFKRGVVGSIDVGKLRVTKDELLDVVRQLDALARVKATKSGLWVYDEDLYKRLVVFSAFYGPMKAKSSLKTLKLVEVVKRLDDYSLHFWYTEVLDRYRQRGVRAVRVVSRAARILYGVDKK